MFAVFLFSLKKIQWKSELDTRLCAFLPVNNFAFSSPPVQDLQESSNCSKFDNDGRVPSRPEHFLIKILAEDSNRRRREQLNFDVNEQLILCQTFEACADVGWVTDVIYCGVDEVDLRS